MNMIKVTIYLILSLILLYVLTQPTVGLIQDAGQQASEGCGTIAQLLAEIWHIELC